ncbi:MAG: hypothetical protein CME15_10750 [Gemmatimonadetes bacterium]|nr:hypothetical protein [Gemmatimonadota bacterium]
MKLSIWMLLAGHVGARLETGQFHLQLAVRPSGPADDVGGLPQYLLLVGEGSRRTRRLLGGDGPPGLPHSTADASSAGRGPERAAAGKPPANPTCA